MTVVFTTIMDVVSEVAIGPCTNSKFVQPFRVNYKQNGRIKMWDCTNVHDSVAVLIFNVTTNSFVLVRQFRPAVYMSRHKDLWKDSEVFPTTLSNKSEDEDSLPRVVENIRVQDIKSKQALYGPGTLGCTYELCAGIVDKTKTLKQIALDEVYEETGYNVPLAKLECITSYYSSMGHAGSHQTLFYCEITDDMKKSEGGGNPMEGEEIEVVNLPLENGIEMVFDQDKPRSTGLLFALMWFEHYKRPLLKTM